MRITDIQINSFGHWSGLGIHGLSDGVTVIHGPNEAGKSTLLQFVRAILYGFSPHRHRRFVPPVYGGRVGGSVSVTAPHGRYSIERFLPASGRLEDSERAELTVQSLDGSLQGKQLLSSLLAGVDDAIFHNVFAVGLTEMQHLGTLSDTEAAQQLYGLAMGADRVSLMEVRQWLHESREIILSDEESTSLLPPLLERREALHRELRAVAADSRRWNETRAELTAVQAELNRLEQERKALAEYGDLKKVSAQVTQLWNKARPIHSQIRKLDKYPRNIKKIIHQIDQTTKQIQKLRKQWEKLKTQRARIKEQAKSAGSEQSLQLHAAEIEQLYAKRTRLKNVDNEIERLQSLLDEIELELREEWKKLGVSAPLAIDHFPILTEDLISRLRGPADEAERAKQLIQDAEREESELRRQAESLERQLQSVVAEGTSGTFGNRLERLQTKMELLRLRLQLETKAEKLKRTIKQLQIEAQEWRERQVLPWRGLMALGTIFAAGVVMICVGLFGSHAGIDEHRRWMLGIMGACVSLVAPIVKSTSELSAQRSEDLCEEEIEKLKNDLRKIQKQIDETRKQLPPSTQPLTAQLEETEKELAELEEFVPLEGQRKQLIQEAESAAKRRQMAEQQLREAERNWIQILREAALPETIDMDRFELLATHSLTLERLQEKWQTVAVQKKQKENELEETEQRVQFLLDSANLIPESSDLADKIDLLWKSLRQEREQEQQRATLHRRWQQLGKQQSELAERAKRLTARRAELIKKCGVESRRELKKVLRRLQRLEELKNERQSLVEQIVEALDRQVKPETILKQLHSVRFLKRLQQAEANYDDLTNQIRECKQRLDQLEQDSSTLIGRRDVSSKQLELTELEAQIQGLGRKWQTLAATSIILDSVQQTYETERQPETLAEASGYLQQLTKGRYVRIWTPFGESSLSVDDQHGSALPVEVLSRGTREQVFLSLRMALVASYGRRGAKLPLILDDVFVNFDRERAEAAAETICQFAQQGFQVLVFTCHEHIRQIFENLEVDICELPKAADLANGKGASIRPQKGIPLMARESKVESKVIEQSPDNNVSPRLEDKDAPANDEGPIYYYLTADELAEIAYNDDFFGDDGTFYPLAGARRKMESRTSVPPNARPIADFVESRKRSSK